MSERKVTPKAKRKSRVGGALKPAAKATKTATAGTKAKSPPKAGADAPASQLSDQRSRDLTGWREETLARMRALILEADHEMIEERKWRKPSNAMAGVPVWSHHGIVCTGETYAKVVKLTFARGASLPDPSRLFNSSLEGNTRRAIDIHEGEQIDARAFKTLVKAAVSQNTMPRVPGSDQPERASVRFEPDRTGASARRLIKKKAKSGASQAPPVKLLSGGNPQIAKADGDAPVQAYIAAMPSWKRDVGRRLDALIVRTVPGVSKAVRWNSPFYGIEGQGWFLGFHTFTNFVKVSFFRGTSLRPVPPGGTGKEGRWIDIHEDDLDESQMATWIRQAAALPGWGKS